MSNAAVSCYIAAPKEMRPQAIELMDRLERVGVTVTARWLKGFDSVSDADARNCLDDIRAADVLLAVGLDEWRERGTGGRHMEMGYAVALDKAVVLFGARTNIYHHLSSVQLVAETEDPVPYVIALAAARKS